MDAPWKEQAIRRVSETVDADNDSTQRDVIDECELDPQARLMVADQQFVDAMLAQLIPQSHQSKEQQIQQVMKAIGELESEVTPRVKSGHHFQGLSSVLILAACLCGICLFGWLQFARESRADDALLRLQTVSLETFDRIYRVYRRTPATQTEEDPVGTLYLRGTAGFVLDCGDIVLGRNADEFWCVSSDGTVLVAESFSWMADATGDHQHEITLLRQLSVESQDVPLMELSSVVELMRRAYDVTMNTHEADDGQTSDQFIGRRRQDESSLPNEIQLWAGSESAVIEKAELTWTDELPDHRSRTLVLELLPDRSVSADWYQHQSHHDQPTGS